MAMASKLHSVITKCLSSSSASRNLLKKDFQMSNEGSSRNFLSDSSSGKKPNAKHEVLYPVENIKDLPIHVQERMYDLQDKAGFIPNLLRAFAHRPDYFRCFLECYDSIADRSESNITKAERELIGTVVSNINQCNYGVVAHSSLLRLYTGYNIKLDTVSVDEFVNGEEMSRRHQLIAKAATSVAKAEPLEHELLIELETVGLNREDIWDAVAFASLISMINRMSLFLDVQPNVEFYSENFLRRRAERQSRPKSLNK